MFAMKRCNSNLQLHQLFVQSANWITVQMTVRMIEKFHLIVYHSNET